MPYLWSAFHLGTTWCASEFFVKFVFSLPPFSNYAILIAKTIKNGGFNNSWHQSKTLQSCVECRLRR